MSQFTRVQLRNLGSKHNVSHVTLADSDRKSKVDNLSYPQ